MQDKLAAVGAIFDFDLRTQLHGLTVYTTEGHAKDGVLIVYADFDPTRLITMAKVGDGFRTDTNGSHVIYSWLDKKNKKEKDGERTRVCGSIMGHRVIFGHDESRLEDALNVIEGKSPSFSGKTGLLEAESGESILVQGLLLKFDFDDSDLNAAIFKMSKAVRVKLSELDKNMTATVRFEASDTDTASQISAIATGLKAVLMLQKGNAEALKLANSVVIKQDGPAVKLTLSKSSAELVDMIKEQQKKDEQKEEQKEEKEQKEHDTNSPPDNK